MSIKKSQVILKCFIDLKFSVWYTLGSENETMFCDTMMTVLIFQVNCQCQGFQNTKWPGVLYFQQTSQIEKIQLNQTTICTCRDPDQTSWRFCGKLNIKWCIKKVKLVKFPTNEKIMKIVTNIKRLASNKNVIRKSHNRLVQDLDIIQCMIVWFSWIFSICEFFIGNSMICSHAWHKYHEWYFKIVIRNFTSR